MFLLSNIGNSLHQLYQHIVSWGFLQLQCKHQLVCLTCYMWEKPDNVALLSYRIIKKEQKQNGEKLPKALKHVVQQSISIKHRSFRSSEVLMYVQWYYLHSICHILQCKCMVQAQRSVCSDRVGLSSGTFILFSFRLQYFYKTVMRATFSCMIRFLINILFKSLTNIT